MAEYWKSTPSYWCKFCQVYVKETPLERKSHESSSRHQGAIQRSLRELSKNHAKEERERQAAKGEVARLNALVGGTGKAAASSASAASSGPTPKISGWKDLGRQTAASKAVVDPVAQRRAHAEQLLALGVELPEELKREITGIGEWQTVATRVVEVKGEEEEAPLTLAGIKKEEEEGKALGDEGGVSRGVRKRKTEEDDDEEEAAPKRKGWGRGVRTYAGMNGDADGDDLDALLSGVTNRQPEVKKEESVEMKPIKREESAEEEKPSADQSSAADDENGASSAPSAVVFKKRKVKR